MIDIHLGIHAYALYFVTILSTLVMTIVLHLIPRAEIPYAPLRLFRAYFLLGILGWLFGATRDIGQVPIGLPISGAIYVVCSLILYLAVSGCARRQVSMRLLLVLHALLVGLFMAAPDDGSILLISSLYIVLMYSGITVIAAKLARQLGNPGHAIIALGTGLAMLGGVAQLYMLIVRNDPMLSLGVATIASSGGFVLVSIGFLSAALLNEHKKLETLALNDPLTGLLNRRGMERALTTVLGLAARNPMDMSAIAIDIDHFKKINDAHGHDGGDIVLRKVAELLSHARRESDVCCRLGGEEFVILLPGTPAASALSLAERIRADLQAMRILINNVAVPVTASLGVAEQTRSIDLDQLLKDADKALYSAKNRGRNQVVLAEEAG